MNSLVRGLVHSRDQAFQMAALLQTRRHEVDSAAPSHALSIKSAGLPITLMSMQGYSARACLTDDEAALVAVARHEVWEVGTHDLREA